MQSEIKGLLNGKDNTEKDVSVRMRKKNSKTLRQLFVNSEESSKKVDQSPGHKGLKRESRKLKSLLNDLLFEQFKERQKRESAQNLEISSIQDLKLLRRKVSVAAPGRTSHNQVSSFAKGDFLTSTKRNSSLRRESILRDKSLSFLENKINNTPIFERIRRNSSRYSADINAVDVNSSNSKRNSHVIHHSLISNDRVKVPKFISNFSLPKIDSTGLSGINVVNTNVNNTKVNNTNVHNTNVNNTNVHNTNMNNTNVNNANQTEPSNSETATLNTDNLINTTDSSVPLVNQKKTNTQNYFPTNTSKISLPLPKQRTNVNFLSTNSDTNLKAISDIDDEEGQHPSSTSNILISEGKGNRRRLNETVIIKPSASFSKALGYFNDIKHSIESFESTNKNYMKREFYNMDKKDLMEKYIQKKMNKVSTASKEESIIHPVKEKAQSSSDLTFAKDGSSSNNSFHIIKKEERRDSIAEQFREITKRKRVEDSISENDDENYMEKVMLLQESEYTIDPDGEFKRYWDFIIMLITAYSMIFTPYSLAFMDYENISLDIVEACFDVIFIFDIVINFFTGYYNYEEDLVKNLRLIAWNYFTGWFILDLVSSVPGSIVLLIINSVSGGSKSSRFTVINKATRFTRFYRTIKFTKVIKIVKISKNDKKNMKVPGIEEMNLTSSLQRFITFILTFLVISHMITCIWIFIGKLNTPSWITRISFQDATVSALYVASLYFHWTTIFTIGYGDIVAVNTTERIYNSFLMFVGILIYSFAVSSLGTIVTTYDSLTARYYKNIDTLEEMRIKYKLPETSYEKLAKYLKYDYKFNKNEKFSFINDLPPKLKDELLSEMYRDIIKSFIFFFSSPSDFTSRVVFCMRPLRIFKKEYLVIEGEYLEEVFFIRRGIVSVHLSAKHNEVKVMEIRRNEHFGDVLIMSNEKSPVTIKVASKVADLLIIRKQDFIDISKEFPDAFEDAIIISYYNFSSLLEMVDKKKAKVEKELERQQKLNGSDNQKDFMSSKLESLMMKSSSSDNSGFEKFANNIIELRNQVDQERNRHSHDSSEDELRNVVNFLSQPNQHVETSKFDEKVEITTKRSQSGVSSNPHNKKNLDPHKPLAPKTFNFNFIFQNNNFISNSSNSPPHMETNDITTDTNVASISKKSKVHFKLDNEVISFNTTKGPGKFPTIEEQLSVFGNKDLPSNSDNKPSLPGLNNVPLPKSSLKKFRSGGHLPKVVSENEKELIYNVDRERRKSVSSFSPMRKINKIDTSRTGSNSLLNFQTSNISSPLSNNNSPHLRRSSLRIKNIDEVKYRQSSAFVEMIKHNKHEDEAHKSNPETFFVKEFKTWVHQQYSKENDYQTKKLLHYFAKLSHSYGLLHQFESRMRDNNDKDKGNHGLHNQ